MSQTILTPSQISPEEIALLIIRKKGFLNTSHTPGSILASDGKAWRYVDDCLTEVPWSDYERALNSADRSDWPPYTISFTNIQISDDQTVRVDVTTMYDMGISECSRGGNESRLVLKFGDEGWQILDTEISMDWD